MNLYFRAEMLLTSMMFALISVVVHRAESSTEGKFK